MKYDVILFMPVRIKFTGIEAESQLEAIDRAESMLCEKDVVDRPEINEMREHGTLVYVEQEDACDRALVDEEGDEDYDNSLYYVPKGDGCWRVEGDDPPTHILIWYTGGKRMFNLIPFRYSGRNEPTLGEVVKQLKVRLGKAVRCVRIERIEKVPVVVGSG